jgi:hypothetical protein
MRLQGSPSQNSINSQGWPSSNQSSNLHLKNQTQFQDFIADAQFKRVTAEIVSDNLQEKSKPNQSDKYSVYARIDETRKKLDKKHQRDDKSSKPGSSAETQTASKSRAPEKDEYSSQHELNSQLKQLRKELNEVKTLALANQKALNSFQPMPQVYKSGPNSSSSTNPGSTLSQAEIHYLRYGSPKSNLDIWA